jgi:predicted HTH transcriptional regulator
LYSKDQKKVAEKWRKSGGNSEINKQEEKIVKYIYNHSNITSQVAATLLNVKISRSKIILSRLVEKNVILKHGKTKNVYYKLR